MGSAVWYGQSGVASCCLQVSDASPFMQRGPKSHKAFLTLTPTLIGIKNGTVTMTEKGADDIHKGGSSQLILLENVETGKDSQLPSPGTHLAFNIVGLPPHPRFRHALHPGGTPTVAHFRPDGLELVEPRDGLSQVPGRPKALQVGCRVGMPSWARSHSFTACPPPE